MVNRRTAVSSVFGILGISALLLTGCSHITEPGPERKNIRGKITQVKTEGLGNNSTLAEILIEEDPSIPIDEWKNSQPNNSTRKVLYRVLPETEIYRQQADESLVKIGVEALTLGSEVRAWNTGFVVETGLPIAYAQRIILVSPAP